MSNSLTAPRQNDNFALAAAQFQPSTIVGTRLRFSKGRFLIGRGDGEAFDTAIVLHVIDVQCGWIKFEGGQVVDSRIGFPMPERDELGDTDESDWPIGLDGEPQDPWANQGYLYLLDPESGADFTFVTGSWGGRAAVEGLARQVFIRRGSAPNATAIVRLESGFRKTQRFGAIPCPKFVIVGWSGLDAAPVPVEAAPARALLRRDLDDEIPF